MKVHRANAAVNQRSRLAGRDQICLNRAERDRLTPDYLFVLAVANKPRLDDRGRARLRRSHLVVGKKISLSQEDKARPSVDLLLELIANGVTEAGEHELARFQPKQLADLGRREVIADNDAEFAPPDTCF